MDEKGADREPGLGIEPGTTVQIQLEGLKEAVRSVVVGFERGQYLIVRTPATVTLWPYIRKEKQTTVRYLHDGTVYGFRTTILGVTEEPVRLTFLAYPRTIETINLRKEERVPCLLTAGAKIHGLMYKGVVLDISAGGCSFTFSLEEDEDIPELTVDDEMVVVMQPVGFSGDQEFAGTLRSIRRSENRMTVGIQFKDLDGAVTEKLGSYVRGIMKFKE